MTDLQKIKIRVQIAVTAVIGLSSLYIVFTQDENSFKFKWAIGTLGVILGYWIK